MSTVLFLWYILLNYDDTVIFCMKMKQSIKKKSLIQCYINEGLLIACLKKEILIGFIKSILYLMIHIMVVMIYLHMGALRSKLSVKITAKQFVLLFLSIPFFYYSLCFCLYSYVKEAERARRLQRQKKLMWKTMDYWWKDYLCKYI